MTFLFLLFFFIWIGMNGLTSKKDYKKKTSLTKMKYELKTQSQFLEHIPLLFFIILCCVCLCALYIFCYTYFHEMAFFQVHLQFHADNSMHIIFRYTDIQTDFVLFRFSSLFLSFCDTQIRKSSEFFLFNKTNIEFHLFYFIFRYFIFNT